MGQGTLKGSRLGGSRGDGAAGAVIVGHGCAFLQYARGRDVCCVLALQKPRGQNRWVAGANNSIVRVPVRTSCDRGGSYRMRRGAAALARDAPSYNLNLRLRLGGSGL